MAIVIRPRAEQPKNRLDNRYGKRLLSAPKRPQRFLGTPVLLFDGYKELFIVGLRFATHWTIRGSNPGGREIFRTRPHRPWDPSSLLYNEYRLYFPGVKRPGRGVNHTPPSSAEVNDRVELYLYAPSGPSWPVLGQIHLYLSGGLRVPRAWRWPHCSPMVKNKYSYTTTHHISSWRVHGQLYLYY